MVYANSDIWRGVIGSIYAAYLSQSGCEVSVLAGGCRVEDLRQSGLQYREGKQPKECRQTRLDVDKKPSDTIWKW